MKLNLKVGDFKEITYLCKELITLIMTNADFWASMNAIIREGFTTEGLQKLDYYAELFDTRRLVYQRFSPAEQHGCAEGGPTHVIASLLAATEAGSDQGFEGSFNDYEEQSKRGKNQESLIEQWARHTGIWVEHPDEELPKAFGEEIAEGGETLVYDHGTTLVKSIGLEYFIEPILALDRISLHNAYFPQTAMRVLGFGRSTDGGFKIIVEQPYIEGTHMTDKEIAAYAERLGFKFVNPRNWTFATLDVYLSDMHDENVIRSANGEVFVVDCDVRINTPSLRCGGTRLLTTEVTIIGS